MSSPYNPDSPSTVAISKTGKTILSSNSIPLIVNHRIMMPLFLVWLPLITQAWIELSDLGTKPYVLI